MARSRSIAALLVAVAVWWLGASPSAAEAAAGRSLPVTRLQPIGEARLPRGLVLDGAPVGGLSALVYDPLRGVFYALSDDRAELGPARFYRLRIDLTSGALGDSSVTLAGTVVLRDPSGAPYPPHSLDPEGLALGPAETLFVSSEGDPDAGFPPFVRQLELDGTPRAEIALPAAYLPHSQGRAGVRRNLAFESLTSSPDRRRLFTAVENALLQDGPAATFAQPSPSRLLELDTASGRLLHEHLYWTEPVPAVPTTRDGFEVNGLTELLSLGGGHLLALERAYVAGVGNRALLFQLDLYGADDVAGRERIDPAQLQPVHKELLADLGDLELPLENLEGMTLGPRLPDGRESLLLISDDNFAVEQQTQLLAFALERAPLRFPDLQGPGHASPLADSWVAGVAGVVTRQHSAPGRPPRVWVQGLDPGCGSGCGVEVELREGSAAPLPGAVVRIGGWLTERRRPGQLGVTWLRNATLQPTGATAPLPAPVILRPPAASIDDDGLTRFGPHAGALDYLEQLEGMRVEVEGALVAGPTSEHGELVIVAGAVGGPRTAVGGLRQDDGYPHANRLALAGDGLPAADVGDRFDGAIRGVLSYDYGLFRLLPDAPLPPLVRSPLAAEPPRSALVPRPGHLRVATYNLRNLSAVDAAERFEHLARDVVTVLASPEILALQEVQDDSGAADDGVVSAAATLHRLTGAIVAAGGPHYRAVQLDPEDGAEGGRPGGNIRVALLIDPAAVRLVERATPDCAAPFSRDSPPGGAWLPCSPARLEPTHPAFAGDPRRGWSGSRRPLAAELEAGGRQLFVIAVHLSSKSGDDPDFGERQPPQRRSEAQRTAQAERIAARVGELLAADPGARVIVLGDYNEHEGRPPLAVLAATGLVDLVTRIPVADRYSFNYQGLSQLLDHVLVSPALAAGAEVEILHRNSDRAEERRSSDHDPVIVRLDLR